MLEKVTINRAPVLTLWATVVAERLGYDTAAALTLGKAVAGVTAHAKGRRLGVFEPRTGDASARARREPEVAHRFVTLVGRRVPIVEGDDGVRALDKGRPVQPDAAAHYLHQKFGDALDDVRLAMEGLAAACKPEDLEREANALYERFRPAVPEGMKGWGARGVLDLTLIRRLTDSRQ